MTAETSLRFFSVIVPCFSSSNEMVAGIQSVLKQQYENFEVLLVMLPDAEKNLSDALQKLLLHPKIKKIIAPYGDENVARIYGVKSASGDYICFLSPGCEWYIHHLSVLNSELKKNNTLKVLYTIGQLNSGFQNLAINVSNRTSILKQNSLGPYFNLSLSQFCVNKDFFNNEAIPVLKFNSFSDKFIISILSAATDFLLIQQITCNCTQTENEGELIELIDRQILSTVYISRNKLSNKTLIKSKYTNSYFWAIKKLLTVGYIKLSVKYLILYIKTIRRLNLSHF